MTTHRLKFEGGPTKAQGERLVAATRDSLRRGTLQAGYQNVEDYEACLGELVERLSPPVSGE